MLLDCGIFLVSSLSPIYPTVVSDSVTGQQNRIANSLIRCSEHTFSNDAFFTLKSVT